MNIYEYISLTNIAKYRNEVEFLAVWEELHNPDFNRVQFEAVSSEADLLNVVLFGQTAKQYHNKGTILSDIDSLDYEDKYYQRRKTDLENHLYRTYDKIDEAEELLVSAKAKKRSMLTDKITGDNIYKAFIFFDKLCADLRRTQRE